jgi:spore coat protein U-like protein
MKMMKQSLLLASIGALAISGSAMAAGTATANLGVSVTVNNNCAISTLPVTFAAYDPLSGTADDSTGGSVTITCTKGATTTIGLDSGANASGTQRRMSDGATTPDYLNYALYQDAGRGTAWGTSGAGLFTPAAAPDKTARSYTVYGRISAGQDIPAGSYTDTVVAAVNF